MLGLDSVPLSSAESRRVSPSQRLLSSLDMQMQDEARKKYTTFSFKNQRNSNRQKLSKQHKKLGITGPCSTSTFFRGKELFYWVRIGTDIAEDEDILLQNRLGEPFCCKLLRELNYFEIIFCFIDKKCINTCINQGIVPLPLAGTGCNGFCTGQELSLKQPILILYLSSHIHLLKMADLGGGSFKYF